MAAASNFPIPAAMDTKGDMLSNWKYFQQQWEDYEIATGLDKKGNKIRMATLRSIMGKECLRIFQALRIPDADKDDPKKSIEGLKDHFLPTRNLTYERYIFGLTNQGPNQTIDQYVTQLRHLTDSCEYGNLVDDFIKDRIVIGTADERAREQLFKKKRLTLDIAIDICRISELSKTQLQHIKSTAEPDVQFARESRDNYSKHKKNAQFTADH